MRLLRKKRKGNKSKEKDSNVDQLHPWEKDHPWIQDVQDDIGAKEEDDGRYIEAK